MKNIVSFIPFFLLAITLSASSCTSSKKTQSQQDSPAKVNQELVHTIVPDTFVLPSIPESITDTDKRANYLTMHYWDRFDFKNREMIQRPEITEQAFVDYINILNYVSKEQADKSLVYTLKKAEVDTVMYGYYGGLFEKYLYDPNSPFRNEEFYIPVLQELIKSPLLNDEEISSYRFQNEMVLKNRVGELSNNFEYTIEGGQTFSFHDLKSEYTLLMFSNPGCMTCKEVIKQLSNSKVLSDALALNSNTRTMLTILTLFPDNDLEEWFAYLPQMPSNWIHGYDKNMQITYKKLYDIKAIPTLYLFDKDKKVILKDTSIGAIESFFTVL